MVIGMAVPVTPVAATGDVRLTRMVVEPPPAGGHRIRVAVAAAMEAVLPVKAAVRARRRTAIVSTGRGGVV